MVVPERLERPTFCFEDRCSIQLSYRTMVMVYHYQAVEYRVVLCLFWNQQQGQQAEPLGPFVEFMRF